jgi:Carboxypeptidase regulatory-like domain
MANGVCFRRCKCVFALFLFAIVSVATLPGSNAQTATGGITGIVTDPNGLATADAAVTVKNTDTGAETTYTSNGAGLYAAPYLQPGHYEVSVSKAGFTTVTFQNVVVHVGDTLTLDAKLPLQSQSTSITVTDETPLLESNKTSQEQVVSETLVDGLPIAARRWENFVLLTPAVTTDGNSGLSSFRGISGLYNGNSVDGANNTQAFFSEARGRAIIVSYVYSADSIQEFQVSNSNYSAEYGQAAGGVVNAVTKSGTNQWHGDLFYNLRYPDLNALDPFSKTRGIFTQTVHQQNQFGGSTGGPIVKDKLFFFARLRWIRRLAPMPRPLFPKTTLERLLATSSRTFSLASSTIRSTATTTSAPSSTGRTGRNPTATTPRQRLTMAAPRKMAPEARTNGSLSPTGRRLILATK